VGVGTGILGMKDGSVLQTMEYDPNRNKSMMIVGAIVIECEATQEATSVIDV
jgi:hypothetical protein